MPIDWFASFKELPWSKALAVAPAIAERGKKLWDSVTSRGASPTPAATATPRGAAETAAALEVRFHAAEARVAHLEQEVVASFEVVNSLAEQNSELVRAVDMLLARTRVLLRVCALLAISIAALFLLILST
jgi:hypothetical protein